MPDPATLRGAARQLLDAAIAAGDAGRLTRAALERVGPRLVVAGSAIDLRPVRRVVIVGMGKASGPMARTAEDVLGDLPVGGLVVVKDLRGAMPRRVRAVEAGHPIPDARGQAAAEEILGLVQAATADDLVLCLISGGGSALAPAPVPGVSLAEKQGVTRLLLEAGATINELNAVRKHLSALKGGQLARAAAPAPVVALLLSDVIGDPLDVIASGPTAPDPTTFGDALDVLDRFGLRGRVAASPKPGDPALRGVTNRVIGNNGLVVDAARREAERLGFQSRVLTCRLEGEAREAAGVFAAVLREAAAFGQPVARPACVIAAGETTVTVRGPGRGGRCQEFALAVVEPLAGVGGLVVLAAGTDGSDGPTDAAGAIVDGTTLERARREGLSPQEALATNDSHGFFSRLGDLVVTGPTGTNLMDLYVGLVGPVPES